jgi:hypothetical protein
VTRFEMDMTTEAMLVCRNVRMLPVVGSLSEWRLVVTIAGSAHASTLSKLFTLQVKEVLLQTNSWKVDESGPDVSYTTAESGSGFSSVKSSGNDAPIASKQVHEVLCEGDTCTAYTAEMIVRRTAECDVPESSMPQQGAAAAAVFDVVVVWSLQGTQAAPRVGLFRLGGVQPLDLIQDTSVRLQAEVRRCEGVENVVEATIGKKSPGSGLVLLKAPQGPLGHTDVELALKIRNNGPHAVTLWVECGDLVQLARRAAVDRSTSTPRSRSDREAGALVALPQSSRHHWLGPVRRHVHELQPMTECEMPAHVRLLGCGPFSVQDYVCTWRGVTGARGNRATQGPVLAFMVEPNQGVLHSGYPVAEALAQPTGSASVDSLS